MTLQLAAALLRAVLVLLVTMLPSVILPWGSIDDRPIVAFLAISAAAFVFVEYNAPSPGFIEFREGRPYNRIRFLTLAMILLALSLLLAGEGFRSGDPGADAGAAGIAGWIARAGAVMDLPYSPVRLIVISLEGELSDEHLGRLRAAAGVAWLIACAGLALLILALHGAGWPARGRPFNIWVNLPIFQPGRHGDMRRRLEREARLCLATGFLVPFLVPAGLCVTSAGVATLLQSSPLSMIWMVTAWAMIPVCLMMRGVALGRLAAVLAERRRRGGEVEGAFIAI